MALLPAAQEDAALDAMFVPSTVYYMSLHSASPGTSGANEISGGSYARQAITFGSASGGSKVSSGTDASQSFTGLPAESGGLPYAGVWSALSGGTYLGGLVTTGLSGSIGAGATVDFASGEVGWSQS